VIVHSDIEASSCKSRMLTLSVLVVECHLHCTKPWVLLDSSTFRSVYNNSSSMHPLIKEVAFQV
jgi:hypothetical protein